MLGLGDNPFTRIILQNLTTLRCFKCRLAESVLTNHGRDKCGTTRLKCSKCTSSGSIRAYANSVPFPTIKAVISNLEGMISTKKALDWCNLFQELVETEDEAAVAVPLAEQVKQLIQEVSLLRLELATARSEIKRLTTPTVNTKRTFVDAAMTKPSPITQSAKPIMIKRYDQQRKTLTEVIKAQPVAPRLKAQPIAPRIKTKPVSDMELVFFKGVDGESPSKLRQRLTKNGFDGHLAKDITYLTEDVVQFLTYSDKVGLLTEAVKKCMPKSRRAINFDPTDPDSYQLKSVQSKATVSRAYFATLDQSVQRLKKCVVSAPSLQRSMKFLARVVEMKDTKYAPASLPPKFETSPPKFKSFFEKTLARATTGPAADINMDTATNAQ